MNFLSLFFIIFTQKVLYLLSRYVLWNNTNLLLLLMQAFNIKYNLVTVQNKFILYQLLNSLNVPFFM